MISGSDLFKATPTLKLSWKPISTRRQLCFVNSQHRHVYSPYWSVSANISGVCSCAFGSALWYQPLIEENLWPSALIVERDSAPFPQMPVPRRQRGFPRSERFGRRRCWESSRVWACEVDDLWHRPFPPRLPLTPPSHNLRLWSVPCHSSSASSASQSVVPTSEMTISGLSEISSSSVRHLAWVAG